MEGYFTALLFSGAALVTHGPSGRQRWLSCAVRRLTVALAILSVVAMAWGFLLHEWLTVSWAVGLCGCCVAMVSPLGERDWRRCPLTILIFTLSTVGVVLSVEGLVPNAPWVISQAVTHLTYRDGAHFVMAGNCVLNVTAAVITAARLR